MTDSATRLAPRLLEVMEKDIIPLTRQGVAAGNKVFGAAVLRKSETVMERLANRVVTTIPAS